MSTYEELALDTTILIKINNIDDIQVDTIKRQLDRIGVFKPILSPSLQTAIAMDIGNILLSRGEVDIGQETAYIAYYEDLERITSRFVHELLS